MGSPSVSDNRFANQYKTEGTDATLGLLNALEDGEPVSQRGLSVRLGVALGLTNSLIKRCVRKGLIKISTAPARRYAYYLTPKGFQEKARLTAEYLAASLDFYRRSRAEYMGLVEYCASRNWRRVALYGISELAEIATVAGNEVGFEFVLVIGDDHSSDTFCNIPVIRSLDELDAGKIDAVILTDTVAPQASYERLRNHVKADRVLAPDVLKISRQLQPSRHDVRSEAE
jgi:DNA-binding MarR family transcriptional regulator